MDGKEWAETLQRYTAPDRIVPCNLTTPGAHRQALEIAHELSSAASCFVGTWIIPRMVMFALAFHVARACAQDKPIKSLGYIAEQLMRKVEDGDDCWAFDLPPRIDAKSFQTASALATQAVKALKGFDYGIKIEDRHLMSTVAIEKLADLIGQYGHGSVVGGINYTTRNKIAQDEGRMITGWGWFIPHINAAIGEAQMQQQHARGSQPPRATGKRGTKLPPY